MYFYGVNKLLLLLLLLLFLLESDQLVFDHWGGGVGLLVNFLLLEGDL